MCNGAPLLNGVFFLVFSLLIAGNHDSGERLSFTLTTGYDNLRDVLTILREQAGKAGLEFRLEVLDGTAAWKKVNPLWRQPALPPW